MKDARGLLILCALILFGVWIGLFLLKWQGGSHEKGITTDTTAGEVVINLPEAADEKYFWTQAIEEVIFQWDRSESGNHPIFQDPTLEEHHTNSDYGGNITFFGNGAESSPGAANSYMSIFKLARPATSVFVCTADNPSSAKKQGSPLVNGSYVNSGSGNGVPHARLSRNQVGLVFADGHVELVDGERLDSDDDYRKRLFDPSAL